LNCASKTSSRGVNFTGNNSYAFRVDVQNSTNTAFISSTTNSIAVLCSATGCTTAQFVFSNVNCFYCVAYSNTPAIAAFLTGVNYYVGCAAISNTGSGIYGFYDGASGSTYVNCLAYGNGGTGFRRQAAFQATTCINCRSEK